MNAHIGADFRRDITPPQFGSVLHPVGDDGGNLVVGRPRDVEEDVVQREVLDGDDVKGRNASLEVVEVDDL